MPYISLQDQGFGTSEKSKDDGQQKDLLQAIPNANIPFAQSTDAVERLAAARAALGGSSGAGAGAGGMSALGAISW